MNAPHAQIVPIQQRVLPAEERAVSARAAILGATMNPFFTGALSTIAFAHKTCACLCWCVFTIHMHIACVRACLHAKSDISACCRRPGTMIIEFRVIDVWCARTSEWFVCAHDESSPTILSACGFFLAGGTTNWFEWATSVCSWKG